MRRFDSLEVGLIVVLVAAGTWTLKPTPPPLNVPGSLPMLRELNHFHQQFGPVQYTEHAEEWAIRDFYRETRNGVFVDVGASDYMRFSNTYYLETALGWSGIAIDPLTQFAAGYEQHRPRTKFRPFFVSDVSNDAAKLYILANGDHTKTSGVKSVVERHGATTVVEAPTITLNDLLTAEGVDRIDFLSMDIEQWEPKALAGFDLQKYRPSLVCIEAHPDVRQTILDYFWKRGYVLIGKYLRIDQYNLYFTPIDHPNRPQ